MAAATGSDSTFSVRSDLTWVEIDGEIVVYDELSRRLHRLNPSAAILWKCLDGESDLRTIAMDIADLYGTEAATVLGDISVAAHALLAEGLLTQVCGPDPDRRSA